MIPARFRRCGAILLFALVAICQVACHVRGEAVDRTIYCRTAMRATAGRGGVWAVRSANYIDGAKFYRQGTALRVERQGRDRLDCVDPDGARVQVSFEARHNMMDFAAWRARQFSETQEPLPADLTELERQCIDEGRAKPGISRQALFLAIGYPAATRAPDLRAPALVYATDMFGTRRFEFDDTDHLVKIVD